MNEYPDRPAGDDPGSAGHPWQQPHPPAPHPHQTTPPSPRAAREQAEVDAALLGHQRSAPTAPHPGAVPPPPRRHGWAALTGTAAAAALLASVGTAALTGTVEEAPPAAGPAATQTVPVSQVVQPKSADWAQVTAAVEKSVVALEVSGR